MFVAALLPAPPQAPPPDYYQRPTSLAREYCWGFDWQRHFSLGFRGLALLAVGLAAIPRVNSGIRSVLRRAFAPAAVSGRGLHLWLCAAIMTAFAALAPSQTLYGDAADILFSLSTGRDVMNWKEPLDLFVKLHFHRFAHARWEWSPSASVAFINWSAGVAYWVVVVAMARQFAAGATTRFLLFWLIACAGVSQLFFCYIENYSLLGVGVMLHCLLGARYLRTGQGLAWTAWTLALTFCFHLSAAWLVPTLPLLAALRLCYRTTTDRSWFARPSADEWRRFVPQAIAAVVGAVAIGGMTLLLGLSEIGDFADLSFAAFGGGDHALWVPLAERTSPYHKYTLLSFHHIVAVFNQWILVGATGLFLVFAYLAFTPRAVRRYDGPTLFLSACSLSLLAYSVLFNADRAVNNVGLLGDWDLFSPVAYPVMALGAYLLSAWEPDPEVRDANALLLVVLGTAHAAPWILANARLTF
jgi:hypothetical protein